MFFLRTLIPFHLEFDLVWWNFSEAGHGKGPADGVSAAIKRRTDNCVLADHHINSGVDLFGRLYQSGSKKIKLFLVDHLLTLPPDLQIPSFPGTMKIHQIHVGHPGVVCYRELSCYCNSENKCHCYPHKTVMVDVVNICVTLPAENWLEQEGTDPQQLHDIGLGLTEEIIQTASDDENICNSQNPDARTELIEGELFTILVDCTDTDLAPGDSCSELTQQSITADCVPELYSRV